MSRRFGLASPLFRDAAERLASAAKADGSFEFWRFIWRSVSDAALFERSTRSFLERRFDAPSFLAALEPVFEPDERAELCLFVLQTFAAQTIFSFVATAFELSESERFAIWGATPFDWGASIRPLLDAATAETLKSLKSTNPNLDASDLLADFYARLFPAEQRRALGEFYTPAPLAARLIDRALAHFEPARTAETAPFTPISQTVRPSRFNDSARFPSILDPTCGDGAFLTSVLRRRLTDGDDPAAILDEIAGFDLSPLAVLAARARLAFAATANVSPSRRGAELRRIAARRRSTRPNEPILPIFFLDAVQNRVPTFPASPNFTQTSPSRRSAQPLQSAPTSHLFPFDGLPDYFDARRWAATPDFERRFDVVLGNPPWIAWDRLSDEYRAATKDRWRERGLFTLSGSAALRGGGKKELAGLLVYETLDRRLRDGGVLAFVVPKSLFQSREAGNGFRRFGSNPDATRPTPFRVLEIDDFSDAPLFSGVASKFATFCARRGESTTYPIPVRRWRATRLSPISPTAPNSGSLERSTQSRRGRRSDAGWRVEIAAVGTATPTSDAPGAPLRFEFETEIDSNAALPLPGLSTASANAEIDALVSRLFAERSTPTSLNSPQPAEFETLPLFADAANAVSPTLEISDFSPTPRFSDFIQSADSPDFGRFARFIPSDAADAPYVARLGANAAGASGVFWLENVERLDAALVAVRNLGDVGRRKVETVETQVESALVFPLLRWRDVDEFAVRRPTTAILLPQDPIRRRGVDAETMRRDFPAALAYLRRFETTLRDRAAYRKFQSRAPFWSLYNVDPTTFSPIKVVWRRMDSTLRAAVVPFDAARRRPIVPQDTLSTVAVATLDEADYLAAVLNSPPIRRRVAASSVAGSKSFGSPGAFAALGVPRFDPVDAVCRALAEFGRRRREDAEKRQNP